MARGAKAFTVSLADAHFQAMGERRAEELLVLGYMMDWSMAHEIFGLWVDTEEARGPANSAGELASQAAGGNYPGSLVSRSVRSPARAALCTQAYVVSKPESN